MRNATAHRWLWTSKSTKYWSLDVPHGCSHGVSIRDEKALINGRWSAPTCFASNRVKRSSTKKVSEFDMTFVQLTQQLMRPNRQ
eukprot:6481563-Amphidinium_carterae.2